MDKEELKKVLFDYKRDKKRLDHIREKYYSMQSIRYDKDKVQSNKGSKEVEQKVINLLCDPEYIELDKKTKAVERVKAKVDHREAIVFEEYFINKKSISLILVHNPISRRTIFRDINRILIKLEKELKCWHNIFIISTIVDGKKLWHYLALFSWKMW